MPTYLNSSPLNLTFFADTSSTVINNIANYTTINGTPYVKSLFNNSQMAFFPNGSNKDGSVSTTNQQYANSSETYDVSTGAIIDYTSQYPSMSLKAADFAFLKNIGVYPNNRLMVARRFSGGVPDDLTTVSMPAQGTSAKPAIQPISTLISWVPDTNDFINVSFGEEWVDVQDTSFKELLNTGGKAQGVGKGVGSFLSTGGGGIPLPGFTEGLQYQIMNKLKISNLDPNNLPLGNPNLIREAMMRKTFSEDSGASGLKCKFEIKMTVEYEQKFIQGVDPGLVYLDILQNILSFATSEAQFQYTTGLGSAGNTFINNLSSGNIKLMQEAVGKFIDAFTQAIYTLGASLLEEIAASAKSTTATATPPDQGTLVTLAVKAILNTVSSTISKYKVKILGILNALTGLPSTPWHITIGNPQKPLFTSGDMYMDNVKLTLGPILSFNDMPSTIKAEFTLKSARNVGAQEIFRKFNSGIGRSYKKVDLSYVESSGTNIDATSTSNTTSGTSTGSGGTYSHIQNTDTTSAAVQQQNQNQQNQQNSVTRQGQSGTNGQLQQQNAGINKPVNTNNTTGSPNSTVGSQPINDPTNASNSALLTRINFLQNQSSLTPAQQSELQTLQNQLNTNNGGGFGQQNNQVINNSTNPINNKNGGNIG